MAEENRELTPQELKPFLVYARQFGVQNFNPQQEKADAEFFRLLKVAYMTGNQSGAEKDNRLLFREQ